MTKDTALLNKQHLMDALKKSYRIWVQVSVNNLEVKKASEVLEFMPRKTEKSRAARESLSQW